jgi:hypothetical protein
MAEVVERHPEEHPEAHERSDVNVRALAIALFALFLIVLVTCLVMRVMFDVYEERAVAEDKAEVRTGIPPSNQRTAPAVPLQGIPGFHGNTPAEDMREMRRMQRGALSTYSPTSEPGYVYIPIERAMELVVEKDLLKRIDATTQPTTRPREGVGHAQ